MTDMRPRFFIWQPAPYGAPTPQVVFDPRIGSLDVVPIVERKLDPTEYGLTIEQLAEKYPLPKVVDVEVSKCVSA